MSEVVDVLVVAVRAGGPNHDEVPAAGTLSHPREEGVDVGATRIRPMPKRVSPAASVPFPVRK